MSSSRLMHSLAHITGFLLDVAVWIVMNMEECRIIFSLNEELITHVQVSGRGQQNFIQNVPVLQMVRRTMRSNDAFPVFSANMPKPEYFLILKPKVKSSNQQCLRFPIETYLFRFVNIVVLSYVLVNIVFFNLS